MRVFGVTGWKNSGKTTLVERLTAHFTAHGLRLATIKHAHKGAEVDRPGSDSFRHAQAGAAQVLLATPDHWALMTRTPDEVPLKAHLARLSPCDLVLIEGFKTSPHPKIEVRAPDCTRPLIAETLPGVRALAADGAQPSPLPRFARDDIDAIARFILTEASAP